MNQIRIFIIVLNWNRAKLLIDCLNSLAGVKSKYNIKIVVVDNASEDDSVSKVKRLFPKVKVLVNKRNLRWPGGNNVGIKYALSSKADLVLLLNNDIIVEKNAVDQMVSVLGSSKKFGIAGPKTYYYKNKKTKIIADAGGRIRKHRFFGANSGVNQPDRGQYNMVRVVDFIGGSAMMIKREVFDKIGLLDTIYGHYYEDVDFCLKARKFGYSSVYVPSSVIYHRVAATLVLNSPLHHYYNTRNHLLFLERYAPYNTKLLELVRLPKTAYEFFSSQDPLKKKYSLLGMRDYLFRRFGERTYW